jgi:vWA-MoxR associated protein C-terminal domain
LHNDKWKKKWKSVQKCQNPLQRFFPGHCNCNVNTLVGQLQNDEVVGLKLESPIKSGDKVIEHIASALYYTGTPIAIWFRCEPLEGDCETQLNNLLQSHLLQLPDRVFKERCQPERHISLIWDDPNRLIPNYQLQ